MHLAKRSHCGAIPPPPQGSVHTLRQMFRTPEIRLIAVDIRTIIHSGNAHMYLVTPAALQEVVDENAGVCSCSHKQGFPVGKNNRLQKRNIGTSNL